jgi:hypothetical protein
MATFSTSTGNGAGPTRNGLKAEFLGTTAPIYGGTRAKATQKRKPYARRSTKPGAAALRAYTAAQFYSAGGLTLRDVAVACGSCPQYVEAMAILLASHNQDLIDKVLAGELPVQAAAKQVRKLVDLVTAYLNASPMDRVNFARIIGPARLWDEIMVPVI